MVSVAAGPVMARIANIIALARITRSSHGRPGGTDVLALKYPAFAVHLAQRLLQGSIFENGTQLCLSEGPDMPNAAGCRRSDGSYSAREMQAPDFSMTCQTGERGAKARIALI